MILEFKVSNFLSFKDEQVLSFEATSDKYLSEYHTVEVKPGARILKTAMIYGANASGKTNILRALDFLREFAVIPKTREEPTGFVPFKFDKNTVNKPGKFEITFFIEKTKFVYSFSLDEKTVYEEKVIFYASSQPSLLFERKYHKKKKNFSLEFGSSIKIKQSYKEVLMSNILNNMSVISAFSRLNLELYFNKKEYEKIESVSKIFINIYTYLNSVFVFFDREYFMSKIAFADINDSDNIKKTILENIKKADINITDYEIVGENINTTIIFTHKTNNGIYKLSWQEESSGTLLFFALSAVLADIKSYDTIAIDELESSLHPELVNHFINTFLYQSKNKRLQLIFTTHNIDLLDEEFVRKDIVWFTDKKEDGSTELYSLSDFKIRKELSFSKAYKNGAFGATPIIDTVY